MTVLNPFRRRLRSLDEFEPARKFRNQRWKPFWNAGNAPRSRHRRTFPGIAVLLLAAAIGTVGYYGFANGVVPTATDSFRQGFDRCGYLKRNNCVVDGDTFVFAGEKIRIADIDTPETGGAQRASEAALGARATVRLRELLNEGSFELRSYQSRDKDQYGRKLRVVIRDGRSIGETLIAEGLARRWSGRRMSWCA